MGFNVHTYVRTNENLLPPKPNYTYRTIMPIKPQVVVRSDSTLHSERSTLDLIPQQWKFKVRLFLRWAPYSPFTACWPTKRSSYVLYSYTISTALLANALYYYHSVPFHTVLLRATLLKRLVHACKKC